LIMSNDKTWGAAFPRVPTYMDRTGMFGQPINAFGGTKIIVSNEAYKMVPIYPDKPRTKRRLRRTLGKYGRTDRMNPMAYDTPHGMIVHPIIYQKLKKLANGGTT
jgi:hypothetical protein